MKRYKTNVKNLGAMALFAACAAIAAAGVSLPASAECIAHWDFGSDALGEVDRMGNYRLDNRGVTIADGAAVFDGVNARELSTHSAFTFVSDRAYTIECFMQADAGCDGIIMELHSNYNYANGTFILHMPSGATVRDGSNSYNGEAFDNANSLRGDGLWHHVAMIVNPQGATPQDKVQLYVDWLRQTNRGDLNSNNSFLQDGYHLYIGSRSGTSYPFKGKIDDVRISEGVLSTDEFLKARSTYAGLDVRAYWKFDDGKPLADSSGNGNPLQGSQGVTFANGCATFDGSASNVRTVDKLDLSAYKDVTVECFVRKHLGMNDVGMILEHSPHYWNNVQGFHLTLDEDCVGAIHGTFRFSDGYRDAISPSNAVNTGWHHIALVKDSSKAGASQCVRFYVDGVQHATGTFTSTASGENLLNDHLYIGSRSNSGIFLNADIDDVRITAQALHPGQFLQTRTGPLEDVIAYWPFNKASTMLADASGNGNALTGCGVTVSNGAAVFDGSQKNFRTVSVMPLYAYESMTLEWFMKTSMAGTGIVLEDSPSSKGRAGAFVVLVNDSYPVQAGYRMVNGYNVVGASLDGGWHHYALVYDKTNTTADVVRFYRDGVKMTTHPYLTGMYSGAKLCTDALFIGGRGSESENPFVGEIDDIRITGRALAPAEFMTKRSTPPGMVISFR